MGNELVMACEAKVSLTNGVHGGLRCPACKRSNCMAAKQKYDAISATTAGGTHHQSKCRKTAPKPESSEVFDDSAQNATMTSAKPMTTRIAGHARRRARRTRRRVVGETASAAVGAVDVVTSMPSPGRVRAVPLGTRGPSGGALAGPGVGEPLPGQLQR